MQLMKEKDLSSLSELLVILNKMIRQSDLNNSGSVQKVAEWYLVLSLFEQPLD